MKDMIKRIREEREGFTLAELLIVVAIIAVLVAIAIPVFNSQLEKSREAVDAANIRAAYAELMTDAITNSVDTTTGTTKYTVSLEQQTADWQSADLKNGLEKNMTLSSIPEKGGKAVLTYTAEPASGVKNVTVTFSK